MYPTKVNISLFLFFPGYLSSGKQLLDFTNCHHENEIKTLSYFKYKFGLLHCVKSVKIRSYFWSVFSCIQSECRKIRTRKTPYMYTFHAVLMLPIIPVTPGNYVHWKSSKIMGVNISLLSQFNIKVILRNILWIYRKKLNAMRI